MSAAARLMPHDYVIGNGDLLDLEVFDVKELSRVSARSARPDPSASPSYGSLARRRMTEVQAEQKISEILESNGLVSHAEVSLSVKERKSKRSLSLGLWGHAMVVQADRP